MIYSGIKNILKKFRDLLLDDVYYLGSLYCTFNGNDNPNGRLPGTWERLPNGVFIRNAGGNAGAVGQVQNESLPDINGTFRPAQPDNGGGLWFSGASNSFADGALYFGGDEGRHHQVTETAGDWGNSRPLKIQASRSNAIYNGSHVTPVNVALYMWRRTA